MDDIEVTLHDPVPQTFSSITEQFDSPGYYMSECVPVTVVLFPNLIHEVHVVL